MGRFMPSRSDRVCPQIGDREGEAPAEPRRWRMRSIGGGEEPVRLSRSFVLPVPANVPPTIQTRLLNASLHIAALTARDGAGTVEEDDGPKDASGEFR